MPPEQRYVDEDTLRRLFNEARYSERVQTGEFQEQVVYDGTPSTTSNQARGTRSQRVEYRDHSGRYVATVHQFTRPDGTLGASGSPDPKRIRIGNIVYSLRANWDLAGD